MFKNISPYKNSNLSKKRQITKMFDTISNEYDRLNRVISFGIDIKWRNKVVNLIKDKNPENILDIATGTGDLAINLTKTRAKKIIGLDISEGMLNVGRKKIKERKLNSLVEMIIGDSENLPFENDSFDAISVAFGVRNFETLEKGLSEIYRVLKVNGVFVVLETSVPQNRFIKQVYFVYTMFFLPLIGKLFSRDKTAYGYLSASAAKFPFGKDFNNILKKIGFTSVEALPQTFGVATIYTASKK